MNCKELSLKICDLIQDCNHHEYQIQQIIQREREAGDQSWFVTEQELFQYKEAKIKEINNLLNSLYKNASNEYFNFYDAPFSVYKNCVDINLNNYLIIYKDALDVDFYEEELLQLNKPEEYRLLKDKKGVLHNYHNFLLNKRSFDISLKRKKELIVSKIEKIGYKVNGNTIIKNSSANSEINYTYLNNFINISSNSKEVKQTPFMFLYYNEIVPFKDQLKNEISENLLKLDVINKKIYIDYVVDKIESHSYNKFDSKSINQWISKYGAKLKNFPNFKKEKLCSDLKNFHELSQYNRAESNSVLELQTDFFKYAIYKVIKEILTFIDQYSNNVASEGLKGSVRKFNIQIFKSHEAETWFNNTLVELSAIDANKKKAKGLQAKASAIFYNKNCKENIFKYNLLLKTYIVFLNKEYSAAIKDDSKLSKGESHENKVKELIGLYLNK